MAAAAAEAQPQFERAERAEALSKAAAAAAKAADVLREHCAAAAKAEEALSTARLFEARPLKIPFPFCVRLMKGAAGARSALMPVPLSLTK